MTMPAEFQIKVQLWKSSVITDESDTAGAIRRVFDEGVCRCLWMSRQEGMQYAEFLQSGRMPNLSIFSFRSRFFEMEMIFQPVWFQAAPFFLGFFPLFLKRKIENLLRGLYIFADSERDFNTTWPVMDAVPVSL